MATKKKTAGAGKKSTAAARNRTAGRSKPAATTRKTKSKGASMKKASSKTGSASSRKTTSARKKSTSGAKTRGASRSKASAKTKSGKGIASGLSAAFINRLHQAAGDLEKFQDELAKGKTAAQEKYEELKKGLNEQILAAQKKFKTGDGKKFNGLHTDLSKLQEQLAHGKAETLAAFNDQKKRIFRAVSRLDGQIPSAPFTNEIREKLHDEMEKFRIKMDLLRSYYEEGKKTVTDTIEEKKHDFEEVLAKVRKTYDATKKEFTRTKNGRTRELKEAYRHLRKAFVTA